MGRQLLGYRVRGTSESRCVYLCSGDKGDGTPPFFWSRNIMNAIGLSNRRAARTMNARVKSDTLGGFFDIGGHPIEVSDVKIVSIYLKTNEYKSSFFGSQVREDLNDFCRAVLDEIDRRNIDAFVEPESFKGMPTTLCFRGANNDFVWVPIVRYAVVDGPKETRASRTVDRMLSAIGNVAKSLSGVES